jgi:predicted amidohydrolase
MQLQANFDKACSFIRSAASQGCDLAVLPEYHLTGWLPDDPKFFDLADQSPQYLEKYCALAQELKICIVPGTIVSRQDSDLLNVAYFISNDGKILSTYQKKNLWHPERPHLTPGGAHEPHEAFDTPLGKCGLLICWDLAFPEAFRELIARGAEIIIVPTFWTLADCTPAGLAHNPRAEALFLESTLISRAYENTCAVIFCNTGCAPEKAANSHYAGLSQVAVPFQGALGKLGNEEGMSVVELDMQILADAEENYKVREDMGREGWHYSYTLTRDEGKSKL